MAMDSVSVWAAAVVAVVARFAEPAWDGAATATEHLPGRAWPDRVSLKHSTWSTDDKKTDFPAGMSVFLQVFLSLVAYFAKRLAHYRHACYNQSTEVTKHHHRVFRGDDPVAGGK